MSEFVCVSIGRDVFSLVVVVVDGFWSPLTSCLVGTSVAQPILTGHSSTLPLLSRFSFLGFDIVDELPNGMNSTIIPTSSMS